MIIPKSAAYFLFFLFFGCKKAFIVKAIHTHFISDGVRVDSVINFCVTNVSKEQFSNETL